MNLFKKAESKNGMIMSISTLKGITFKQLKTILGKPDKEEFYINDIQHNAKWALVFLGIKFEIRVDSSRWASDAWPDKKKYQIPDIKEDFVDLVEIIGEREFVENIVIPILNNIFKGETENTKYIIQHIFEEL